MLRYLILLLVSAIFTANYGQSFSVTPNPVNMEVDLSTASNPIDIVAEAVISNHTTDTLRLKWERVVNDIPACWTSSVLGVWIQALPFVDSLNFNLLPNGEGHLNVSAFTAFADGTPTSGEAEVVLKVTNLDSPSDTIQVVYTFSATGATSCVTSTNEIEQAQGTIFPNPAVDFFSLNGMTAVRFLRVYDATGACVRQYRAAPEQSFYVGDLPTGVYLVQLLDADYRLVQTSKLVKQ